MQVKIFSIPIHGSEALENDLNRFLRAHKVTHLTKELVSNGHSASWCFCVEYVTDPTGGVFERNGSKPDYKMLLEEEVFKRFDHYRTIRKQLAKSEGTQAYNIFTDEELSELAKVAVLTPEAMRSIKGIGAKKVEKYGHHFLPTAAAHETPKPTA